MSNPADPPSSLERRKPQPQRRQRGGCGARRSKWAQAQIELAKPKAWALVSRSPWLSRAAQALAAEAEVFAGRSGSEDEQGPTSEQANAGTLKASLELTKALNEAGQAEQVRKAL